MILPFGQNDGYNVRQQVQSISVILPFGQNDTGVGWVEEGNPTSPGYVADIRYAVRLLPSVQESLYLKNNKSDV